MEIKFRTDINEYIDLFMYGRLCEKNWNKEVRIRQIFVFITIMIFVLFEGKFYNVSYSKSLIFSVLMGLLFVMITPTIYRFTNRRNIKKQLKEELNNITERDMSVYLDNTYIIILREGTEFKYLLENVEIIFNDDNKTYLRFDKVSLFYIPCRAFNTKSQKNEFIDIINKR